MTQTEMKLAAAARGEGRFNTGVPCKHGHLSDRYTSTGACIECLNPRLTRPRVTRDVRFISRSIPFAIDRRIATSATYLGQLDAYLQACTQAFAQHLESTDHTFPMWCPDCEGKGKTIDPKRHPVVEPCARCERTGVVPMPDLSMLKKAAP